MDAKPQRPLRPFKVRDENMMPQNVPYKSIHQRNKSSPALSTLAKQQAAAFKPAPRRAVFADLSNNNNIYRANYGAKDDSVLGNTKVALSSLREISDQENINPAPLLRPAQRPLSVGGIKGFLNNFASSNTSTHAVKQIQVEPVETARPKPEPIVVTRKPRTKKSTAVLREPDFAISQQPAVLSTHISSIEPAVPTSQLQTSDIITSSQAQPAFETQIYQALSSVSSVSSIRPLPSKPSVKHLPPLPEFYPTTELRSDGVPLYPSYDEQLPPLPSSSGSDEIYVDAQSEFLPQPEPLRPSRTQPSVSSVEDIKLPSIDHTKLPTELLPLPEEYEHLHDDKYDMPYLGDEYTTLTSLKSRDDYTTGPATVIMAPRMNHKAEMEIATAREAVLESKQRLDVEEDEQWDTSMVHEYGDEIFSYMNALEERMRPNPYYMDSQTEIQWFMRSSLMEWLVQVHHTFQMLPETLFLCVNYVDRFLSCKVVSQNKIQLVGATALLVAAKYEEIQCPTISEIRYMAGDSYTVDDILKAERFMLSMLQFELGWPGPMSFLRRISKADDYDLQTRTLAKYFMEVTIMDERFVASIPSYTAAGAHCLARVMLGKGAWSQAHIFYSNYTYSQLHSLMVAILSCCEQPAKHHKPIYEKYADRRFKKASEFVQIELQKGFMLPTVSQMAIWAESEREKEAFVYPLPLDFDAAPKV